MKERIRTSLPEQKGGASSADAAFRLEPEVAERLSAGIPAVAQRVVAAVTTEVPSYADPFRGGMGKRIETAVRVALDGFLDLASNPGPRRLSPRLQGVHDAAYALGQGEARAGRSIDALTSAYGVGARAAWHDIGSGAIDAGMSATDVALFAELVFAYINELSVSSINGHAEELASSGHIRQRRLERLCRKLLEEVPDDELDAAAQLAEWDPPRELTAVLLPEPQAAATALALARPPLLPGVDLAGLPSELSVLLVAGQGAHDRAQLLEALSSSSAIVGPSRPWRQAGRSYARAVQGYRLGVTAGAGPLDTDAHLLELVLGADAGALADLRAVALAPLAGLSAGSRDKLSATLRAWLLHHGRREDIARALFVHPQTVRYRMGQLRDLYGERLTDPRFILELTVAMATAEQVLRASPAGP
jgi:DNA-binding PucR family transcriptional regulator